MTEYKQEIITVEVELLTSGQVDLTHRNVPYVWTYVYVVKYSAGLLIAYFECRPLL